MLQSTAYTSSGQVSLPTMPPTGTYSNYHPFAHLSDFCVPVNFDNSATYFGAAAVYANSYPSHNFGIKAGISNMGQKREILRFFQVLNFHQNNPIESFSIREIDCAHCRILKTLS